AARRTLWPSRRTGSTLSSRSRGPSTIRNSPTSPPPLTGGGSPIRQDFAAPFCRAAKRCTPRGRRERTPPPANASPRRPTARCREASPRCTITGMSEVTRILDRIQHGDADAADQLLPLVYDELRRLAAERMAQERPGQTLQATALVHEAYLRLVDVKRARRWN